MSKRIRKSILDVCEEIIHLLLIDGGHEHSTQFISRFIHSQWRTTIKALEFLKKIELVKERPGFETYKAERVWSLTSKASGFKEKDFRGKNYRVKQVCR